MSASYGQINQLVGLSSGADSTDSPGLLFRVIFLPSSAQSPGLSVFLSSLRSVTPHVTLRLNRDGLFWRTSTINYSHEIYMAPVDYCVTYNYAASSSDFVSLPFLAHDLDAILNKQVSSTGCVSTDNNSTGKSSDRVVELLQYSEDRSKVVVNTYSNNLVDSDCLMLTVVNTDPYEVGDAVPRECRYSIVGPQGDPYTPLVSPRDMLRCMRTHKNKIITVKIMRGGGLIISSENCGTKKQSVLQSLPYTNNNCFINSEIREFDSQYSSELLQSVLRAIQHCDRAHCLVSQALHREAPLVLAVSLGHLSFARFYLAPIASPFSREGDNENKENVFYA